MKSDPYLTLDELARATASLAAESASSACRVPACEHKQMLDLALEVFPKMIENKVNAWKAYLEDPVCAMAMSMALSSRGDLDDGASIIARATAFEGYLRGKASAPQPFAGSDLEAA